MSHRYRSSQKRRARASENYHEALQRRNRRLYLGRHPQEAIAMLAALAHGHNAAKGPSRTTMMMTLFPHPVSVVARVPRPRYRCSLIVQTDSWNTRQSDGAHLWSSPQRLPYQVCVCSGSRPYGPQQRRRARMLRQAALICTNALCAASSLHRQSSTST